MQLSPPSPGPQPWAEGWGKVSRWELVLGTLSEHDEAPAIPFTVLLDAERPYVVLSSQTGFHWAGTRVCYLTDVGASTWNAEAFTDRTNFSEALKEWENVSKIRHQGPGGKEFEGIPNFCCSCWSWIFGVWGGCKFLLSGTSKQTSFFVVVRSTLVWHLLHILTYKSKLFLES